MNNEYICVYDSGVGGLTTLKAIQNLLPKERFIYFADNKNCPYGNKSDKEILNLIKENINKLLNQHKIKMLVLACNTATSCCIDMIRSLYSFPVVGIEPAINLALKNCKNNEVLALMTKATSKQNKYKNLKNKFDGRVHSLALTHLAKNIEDYLVCNKNFCVYKYINIIKLALEKNKKIDSIVLGCTHYVYLKGEFNKTLKVKIYDGNQGVAIRVRELLLEKNKLSSCIIRKKVKFVLSFYDINILKRYKEILKTMKI